MNKLDEITLLVEEEKYPRTGSSTKKFKRIEVIIYIIL